MADKVLGDFRYRAAGKVRGSGHRDQTPIRSDAHGNDVFRQEIDLNAVGMFVAVAQAGRLLSAALKLVILLPTLSRKVAELEAALEVQLLERTVKGCRP